MKLHVNVRIKTTDGELVFGEIHGIPNRDKVEIRQVRDGYVVEAKDGGQQLTEPEQTFVSPEAALAEIERNIQAGRHT